MDETQFISEIDYFISALNEIKVQVAAGMSVEDGLAICEDLGYRLGSLNPGE